MRLSPECCCHITLLVINTLESFYLLTSIIHRKLGNFSGLYALKLNSKCLFIVCVRGWAINARVACVGQKSVNSETLQSCQSSIVNAMWNHRNCETALKPGFHYLSWRPELTARVDGWPVSMHYPSTQSVLTGNGHRSPVNSGRQLG